MTETDWLLRAALQNYSVEPFLEMHPVPHIYSQFSTEIKNVYMIYVRM